MSLALQLEELGLIPPGLGAARLHHVEEFEEFDGLFDGVRDTINAGIRELNKLPGCELPTLPEESLEELLVLPFSGDYRRIRQSAQACEARGWAFHDWAGNVRRSSLAVDPIWHGAAAAACASRLTGWSATVEAAVAVVAGGAAVFTRLADFCELTAGEVERLLVRLAQALERLAARVATKLAGVGGVVSMAIDVARHGFDVVTDLIDDVREVLDLIGQVRGLVDEVREFVDRTRDSLRDFERLRDLVRDVLTDPVVR